MSTIPLSPKFTRGLREAEATYRHLVEGAPAILYIDAVDELSGNLHTSPQIEGMLGYSLDEWPQDAELWIARMHDTPRRARRAPGVEPDGARLPRRMPAVRPRRRRTLVP